MDKVLGKTFFNRLAPVVAADLLGKYLVHKIGKREIAYMIIEVEAYDGHEDRASHASRGMTKRNEPMWGDAGVWYVYLCYGIHEMLNIVTGPKEHPAAVLIRGIPGHEGPGRLTKAMGIDRRYNSHTVSRATGLWIEDRGVTIKKQDVAKGPRIGVHYAGKMWAQKPYRFVIKDSAKYLSA